MNEKTNAQLLNENDLSAVSGGSMLDERRHAKYAVGQMVRFYYIHGSAKETFVPYQWIGKIIEVLNEPEGIFYGVELDEQARQIAGCPHLTLYFDCVFDV